MAKQSTKTRPRPRPQQQSWWSKYWLYVVAGGVILVVAVGVSLGMLLSGDDEGGSEAQPQTTSVEVVGGDLLPPFEEGVDPAVTQGMIAPEVAGVSMNSQALRFTNDGTPRAVVFLAHWCPHCQREVDDLVSFLESSDLPEGVEIQSVSTLVDESLGNYPPSEWLTNAGWPFPVMQDDENNQLATAHGLQGTPHWVFVNGDGTVALRLGGEIGAEQLAGILAQLADGTLSV